jgi:excisionase family DNA binding protein
MAAATGSRIFIDQRQIVNRSNAGDHMSAFQPISPSAAVELLEDADTGLDCAQLLADLAEAGRVRSYARLVEVSGVGRQTSEVRDGRIERAVWKRIVAEDKVAGVYATGSVRLGCDTDPAGAVSVLGIRFDEKSVMAAAVEHGRSKPAFRPAKLKAKPVAQVQHAEPVAEVVQAVAVEERPRRILPDGAVAMSVDEAAAVLGVSRGTVYKLMDTGALESKKVGGRRLVSAASVRALLAQS